MTSPYLLARKPEEEKPPEEVGQTPRRRPTLNLPLQAAEPNRPVETPKWQLSADITKQQFTDATARNVITPPATSLQSTYGTIFPIVKSIGDIAQSGQEAASETRRIREAQIEAARLAEENRKAMEEAYKRSANIPITQYNPNPNIGGATYSGNVAWDGSDAALADMMRKAGFPEAAISIGLGIAHDESGMNPTITHTNVGGTAPGSLDLGIFQINNYWHRDKLAGKNWQDPQTNVNLAYQIWKEAGGNWTPWSTFKTSRPRAVPSTRLTVTATPTYSGGVYATGNGTLRNQVTNRAMVVYNIPYEWGGESLTTGADCSGLVYAVYKEFGIPIPGRLTAHDYAQEGVVGHRVSNVSQLQPGDLIAFQASGAARAHHIAIYAGGNQIIEMYGPNGVRGRRRALTDSIHDRGAIYVHVRFPGE